MKIGNLHIDVDKNKIYTSDEMIDILKEQPGFIYFAHTLLVNNDNYVYFQIPAYPVKNDDNKTFHLEINKKDENDEFLKQYKEIICNQNMPIWEDFNTKFFKSKYRDNFVVSMVQENENDFYVDVFFTDEENVECEKIKYHFKNFLDIAKVDTFKKLREKVVRANEIYNESDLIIKHDDPFEFDIDYNIMPNDLEIFKLARNLF